MSESPEERIAALRSDFAGLPWSDAREFDLEGHSFAARLEPVDEESLGAVLAAAGERALSLLIRGGGSRIAVANRARGADLLLSTRGFAGVRSFEPDDGVIEVGGGTGLAEIRAALEGSGWELPLDPAGAGSTAGGVVASAATGPRNLGFGPVRRSVLGLDVVLATGERTRCGGRVVKNVTGYDLAKLYTGSFGTLGVITGAWLRLQPSPRHLEIRVAEFSETSAAIRLGIEASRRSSARACVLLSPEVAREVGLDHSLAASWLLLIELAGEALECRADAGWLESAAGVHAPDRASGEEARAWIDRVRDCLDGSNHGSIGSDDESSGRAAEGSSQPDSVPSLRPASGLRARLAVLPSRLEEVCGALVRSGTRLIVSPGMGLVHVELRPVPADGGEASRLLETLELLEGTSRRAGGQLLIEVLPSREKRERDVFGEAGPAIEIMKKLKREFDPHGVLNPGRFAGGI